MYLPGGRGIKKYLLPIPLGGRPSTPDAPVKLLLWYMVGDVTRSLSGLLLLMINNTNTAVIIHDHADIIL